MLESKIISLSAFKEGKKEAFELIYRKYVGKTYNYLYAFTNDADLAKDLAQNTFIKLWESRERLSEDKNVEGYIFIIARNLLFKEIRSRNVKNRYEALIKEDWEEASDQEIEEVLSRREVEEKILELLVELPEARRKIFMMRWSKGLSNKEIAKELSISEKTVSTQIHRTLGFLKTKLSGMFTAALLVSVLRGFT